MVVVIIYSEQFKSNAKSLRDAVKNKWPDAGVNLMGTFGKSNDFSKYQIQLDGAVVYSGQTAVDNTTVINSIKDRL